MNRRKYIKTNALGAFIPSFSASEFPFDMLSQQENLKGSEFKSNWGNWPDMKWIGPEYWGNRMQDWKLKNGMAVCGITGTNRNLQLLTLQKTKSLLAFKVGVDMTMLHKNLKPTDEGCFGIRLGSKGPFGDYRSATVFGKGLDIGFIPNGNLQVGGQSIGTNFDEIPETFRLEAYLEPLKNNYALKVSIFDLENGQELISL